MSGVFSIAHKSRASHLLQLLSRQRFELRHTIKKAPITLCALFISLSGCAQDYSLGPPADSEQMTITVKVPSALKARTLQVMYRSTTCKRVSIGGFGQRVEQDGRHGIDVQLQRQGQSDLYQAKLPMDGGGACKWHLANVIFGVVYANPMHFGENVTWGGGGGVVVIFDHNNSPRGGADVKVGGDLTINKDYYPWIDESFIGEYSKDISLLGGGVDYYFSYQALEARSVYFEPVFHSRFLVSSVGPKQKKKGNFATFTYPDGSIENVASARPNFRKLEAIRQAAEAK
ncbi:hypothetical protein SAMN04487857_1327 [Pseudomonas sp. ok272]|uniref:hypothetical protein n=1 Tax=unclassified Pseudomonas TaxID=196821 RepID=UPI0008BEE6E1|nr:MULTISPECIES: hypothetical protein [unclassified Pseudomonas]SEN65783.1 hypothetical protein SAMN04487857_1327 [Pseudomonas sp. ok272]SFN46098.1 hypothetical protein SAMN04487858_1347 [Pseudomonas sp. ok602]